jgi:hypothetical protein
MRGRDGNVREYVGMRRWWTSKGEVGRGGVESWRKREWEDKEGGCGGKGGRGEGGWGKEERRLGVRGKRVESERGGEGEDAGRGREGGRRTARGRGEGFWGGGAGWGGGK